MDLFAGYNAFSTFTAKRANRGRNSGGIIVYIKEWLTTLYLMFKSEIAIFLFLKAENVRLSKHIIMTFTYILSEKPAFYNMYDESNDILMLRGQIAKALSLKEGSSLWLTGDFNARTGNLIDFIKDDKTQFFTGNNTYEPDNFSLPRFVKGTILIELGKYLINMCHETGTHYLNGRFPGDKSGEKTCCTANGTVDYMLATTDLFDNATDFRFSHIDDSYHFPLICQFKFQQIIKEKSDEIKNKYEQSPIFLNGAAKLLKTIEKMQTAITLCHLTLILLTRTMSRAVNRFKIK